MCSINFTLGAMGYVANTPPPRSIPFTEAFPLFQNQDKVSNAQMKYNSTVTKHYLSGNTQILLFPGNNTWKVVS